MTNDRLFDKSDDKSLMLIQENKKKLSRQLDLMSINTNIMNISDLIFVVYNAMEGKQLQFQFYRLQNDILTICQKNILMAYEFQCYSEGIIVALERSNEFLAMNETALALTNLSDCSEKATEMISSCTNLAKTCQKVAYDLQAVLNSLFDKQNTPYTPIDVFKEKLQIKKITSLTNIAAFAETLENQEINQTEIEATTKTAQLAVMLLTHLTASLLEVINFWKTFTAYCYRLKNIKLDEEVEITGLFSSKKFELNGDKINGLKLILSEDACGWYAFLEISTKFLQAAKITDKEILNNSIQVFPLELVWKVAKEKVQISLNAINEQIKNCDDN